METLAKDLQAVADSVTKQTNGSTPYTVLVEQCDKAHATYKQWNAVQRNARKTQTNIPVAPPVSEGMPRDAAEVVQPSANTNAEPHAKEEHSSAVGEAAASTAMDASPKATTTKVKMESITDEDSKRQKLGSESTCA